MINKRILNIGSLTSLGNGQGIPQSFLFEIYLLIKLFKLFLFKHLTIIEHLLTMEHLKVSRTYLHPTPSWTVGEDN